MTLAAAGKTDEALSLLSINEGDAIGHANLGYLLASTGQYQCARQEYQTALTMLPGLTGGPAGARAARPPGAGNHGTADDRDRPQRPAGDGRRIGTVDPQVTRTSLTDPDEILPPPLPPLPSPESSGLVRP